MHCSNDKIVLKDDSYLSFPQNSDIGTLPFTKEQYCKECEKITPAELDHVKNPIHLSPEQQELMHWHCRFRHLPFPRLIKLAEANVIPKRLAKLKGFTPMCVSCIFGHAHKKPWRTKRKQRPSIKKARQNRPGECVSVDTIVSAQPGHIPQMAGPLTNLRIWGVNCFLDHFSSY